MAFEKELFLLIESKKYNEANRIIQQTQDLDVNALNKEGLTLFTYALMNYEQTKECHTFIEHILSNPKFKHVNRPEGKIAASPLKKAMARDSIALLELILRYKDSKKIQMVFEKNKLWYELRADELQTVLEAIDEGSRTFSDEDVLKEKQFLEIFRELTLRHAINTDDPTLLQRLIDAGALIHTPFRSGTNPISLIHARKGSKALTWLSEYTASPKGADAALTLKALEQEHQNKLASVLEHHQESKTARVNTLFPTSKEPEAPKLSSNKAQILERMEKRQTNMNYKAARFESLQNSLDNLEQEYQKKQRDIAAKQIQSTKKAVRNKFTFHSDSGQSSKSSSIPLSKEGNEPSAS